MRHAHPTAVQFHTDSAVRRAKTRSPTPSLRRWLYQISPPAKTSTGFLREFSSAISGFRSLCGRKQRSSFSHRAQLDLRFGTFHSGRALALRTLASTRNIPSGVSTGPATLDRCCERNVVAPGQYSKWFFCLPIGLYDGFFRPATARRTPARSALAGSCCVNPATVIRPPTSPSWPCPTSTTSAPFGASSRAACGMSAR